MAARVNRTVDVFWEVGFLPWDVVQIWLVVEPYPSEKWWSSSVGIMKVPIYGKIKNVPNHQPEIIDIRRFSIETHGFGDLPF